MLVLITDSTTLSLSSNTVSHFGDIEQELASMKLVGLENQGGQFEHKLYRGGLFNKSSLESIFEW